MTTRRAPSTASCSTPCGITARKTDPCPRARAYSEGAQRLAASRRGRPRVRPRIVCTSSCAQRLAASRRGRPAWGWPTRTVAKCAQRLASDVVIGLRRKEINAQLVDALRQIAPIASAHKEGGTRDAAALYRNLRLVVPSVVGEVVLVDDVLTSGGHLRAAAAMLVGASVEFAICAGRSRDTPADNPWELVHIELMDFEPEFNGVDDSGEWDPFWPSCARRARSRPSAAASTTTSSSTCAWTTRPRTAARATRSPTTSSPRRTGSLYRSHSQNSQNSVRIESSANLANAIGSVERDAAPRGETTS